MAGQGLPTEAAEERAFDETYFLLRADLCKAYAKKQRVEKKIRARARALRGQEGRREESVRDFCGANLEVAQSMPGFWENAGILFAVFVSGDPCAFVAYTVASTYFRWSYARALARQCAADNQRKEDKLDAGFKRLQAVYRAQAQAYCQFVKTNHKFIAVRAARKKSLFAATKAYTLL